jgi:ketosteroid isomerase-like protein
MRTRHDSPAVAVSLLLLLGSGSAATADPPPTSAGGVAGGAPAATQGGFLSSLKQAFSQDIDRAVVWGHFDVGSPPNTHRFYCLIDPKTGKREPNGVAGEPFLRRDGTTGLKMPAVSPVSCAEAEQKGTLVTAGYTVRGAGSGATPAPSAKNTTPASTSAPAPTAAPAPEASVAPAPAATPAPAASAAPAMSSAEPAEDRGYVWQAESDWAESVATHDASVLERILADDFIGVHADGTHYSKADAIREYRTQPSSYTSNHLNQVEIRFYGHTAIAQGDESWKRKDGRSGKYVWTDTWVQRDGKWQIVAAEDLVPPAGGSEHP